MPTVIALIRDDSMVFWKNRKSNSPFQRLFSRAFTSQTRSSRSSTPRRSIWGRSGWACLIAATAFSSGCLSGNEELTFYGDDREMSHYVDQATKIEYSTYDQESPQSVAASQPPRRVRHPRKDEVWDLTLEQAMQTALGNAEIIRDNTNFGSQLLGNPDGVSSIHDIAIQESNVLFGQGGVDAALADFDAVLSTQMSWGKNEFPSESGTIGFGALDAQQEETARFNASLSKAMADGSIFSIEHNINYSEVNQRTDLGSSRPFNSQFSGNPGIGMSYRLPLGQGAGAAYTRTAGTIARRPTLQGVPTVNQGVVVARIRTDIAITDFELRVNNLVKDVEDAYWELYLAYRRYDAEMISKESALRTWRQIRVNEQATRLGVADEAQSRDNYYEIRARSEEALGALFGAELRMRRLMGLSVNDGKVVRPVTEPMTAELALNWNDALAEALVHRPELRRQKWNIKSLELQHSAAEKLVRPRLDFVASYAINAFGDQLTGDGPNYHSAYATLMSGKHTNWGLGFEFSMPFGFRGAITQVQNYEHRLAKARAVLAEQELQVSHELAASFQQIDQAYQTAKTNFNRRRAAERRVQAFEAQFDVQRTTLDLVLRAQISLAAAETAYYSSLVNYNRALNDLKFRKGTILGENSVYLTEGVWHEEAYSDAIRRPWERSFAFDVSDWMDETEPEEFVFGCPTCHPSAIDAEPIPEDIELPYEKPAAPLERITPEEAAPVPPADRSALRNGEPEAGGFGSPTAPPYEEAIEPPAVPELPVPLIPESPGSIPVIPDGDGAALFETQGSLLQPVEFTTDAASLPAAGLIEQPIPKRPAAPDDSMPVTFPSAVEDDFAPPVPLDGGFSDDGFFPGKPVSNPSPGSGQSDVAFPFSSTGLAPVQRASRRQLLQSSPRPMENRSEFVMPRNIAAEEFMPAEFTSENDGFPPPLEQAGIVPASGVESTDGSGSTDGSASRDGSKVRQADGETSRSAKPSDEPTPKSSRLPRWGQFFKWGE